MQKVQRLDSLDLLRGIAVIMVCFCHFGQALLLHGNTPATIFNAFDKYGRYGVQMFFVVSGFVIPLSMHYARFTISDYFTFIHKRVLRIHVPYLAALAVSLIIMFVSGYMQHRVVPESSFTVFQSLFCNHIPYNNPVFWTLIIEWQYYFFIGIFYCLLAKYPKFSVGIIIPVLILISQAGWISSVHFISFIAFFLVGNVGFLIYTKQGNTALNILMLAGLILFCILFYQFAAALIATVTILFILFYRQNISRNLLFTGKISYAIYLIHFPIGMKFLSLPCSIIQQQPAWLLFFFTLGMIIILAWLFYKWIEIPAEKLAGKFKYQQKQKALPARLPQLA